MGRLSRTVLGGVVVGTAAHAASTRLRLSPLRAFHSVVVRCIVYDASKPRGLSAWFPLLEPGMSLDQARQQLARNTDALGGRETWGAKLIQAAAEANLVASWLARPAEFSLFNPCRAQGWSDWHQIKGRWRSSVLALLTFCRPLLPVAPSTAPAILVHPHFHADWHLTTRTHDHRLLRAWTRTRSELLRCCRGCRSHIAPA
jgi:hypothetical protein